MQLFKDTTEEKKEKSPKKTSVAKKGLSVKESPLASKLLSRPRITEKSYALNTLNQYVFVVNKEATKKTVKRAIEEVYAVSVDKVRMVCLPAKKRVFGKNTGSKSAIKKAIVSVAKGQSLELFKGGM
jgi:large subunit ribosomal protein L23